MRTMREEIIPVLESYDIDLIVCGHSHVFERSFLIKNHYGYSNTWDPAQHLVSGTNGDFATGNAYIKDKYNQQNDGAVYVVCGHSGSENSDGSMDHPVFCYDDNGTGVTGSFVIDIYRNRLDGKYLRSDGTIQDNFTILKKNLAVENTIDTLCLGNSMMLQAPLIGGSDSLVFSWENGLHNAQVWSVAPVQTTNYSLQTTDELTGQVVVSSHQVVVENCVNNIIESVMPFTIAPNPVHSTLQITAPAEIQSVRLFDQAGSEVLNSVPNSTTSHIDVSGLNEASYVVEVLIKGHVYRKNIVIAH